MIYAKTDGTVRNSNVGERLPSIAGPEGTNHGSGVGVSLGMERTGIFMFNRDDDVEREFAFRVDLANNAMGIQFAAAVDMYDGSRMVSYMNYDIEVTGFLGMLCVAAAPAYTPSWGDIKGIFSSLVGAGAIQ